MLNKRRAAAGWMKGDKNMESIYAEYDRYKQLCRELGIIRLEIDEWMNKYEDENEWRNALVEV